MCCVTFLFLGVFQYTPRATVDCLVPSLLRHQENKNISESLSLSGTARGTCFVNATASFSSPRSLRTYRIFFFLKNCSQIVCTSKCCIRLPNTSRCEIAHALQVVCPELQIVRFASESFKPSLGVDSSHASAFASVFAELNDIVACLALLKLSISSSDNLPSPCPQQLSTCFLSASTSEN